MGRTRSKSASRRESAAIPFDDRVYRDFAFIKNRMQLNKTVSKLADDFITALVHGPAYRNPRINIELVELALQRHSPRVYRALQRQYCTSLISQLEFDANRRQRQEKQGEQLPKLSRTKQFGESRPWFRRAYDDVLDARLKSHSRDSSLAKARATA